jgi:hypothetical protein
MSIENGDFTRASAATKRRHRLVLRFKSMFPNALGRFEMHAARRGGDLSHVDASKTALNSLLIGDADWRKRLEEEIALARAENLAEELEALLRRKRAKERKARILEGMRDPWQASEGGPLREVILTANRLWFQATDDDNTLRGEDRRAAFERAAVDWLQTRFPGMVVHARGEQDELTYHVHAVIAPWLEKTTARRGRQRLLVPTAHPLLNDYEAAQTDAGEFFDAIGLDRGERTKEAQRKAVKLKRAREDRRERIRKGGHEVPDYLREELDPPVPSLRPHVPAPVWWKAERRRLEREALRLTEQKAASDAEAARLAAREAALRKQEEQVKAREADAIGVVEIVEAIAEDRKIEGPLPSGSLGARLIAGLNAIKAKMRKQVEARFSEEGKAIGLLHSAVLALREKMRGSLSPEQWKVVEDKTESEQEAVSKAADRLDAVRKRREDNAR